MSRNEPPHKGQKGFTLIEALVVMIVGIVILAAAAAAIGKLFRSSEVAEEASNITQLRAQLVSLSRSDPDAYLENAQAIQFKAFPANMTVKGSQVFNVWGGPVHASALHGKADIVYFNVPADACQQLILKLWKAGWEAIDVNGDKMATHPALGTPTLKDVGDRCKAGGDKNSVGFRMEENGEPV
jgi:Tfp pilus assembly protein PilV